MSAGKNPVFGVRAALELRLRRIELVVGSTVHRDDVDLGAALEIVRQEQVLEGADIEFDDLREAIRDSAPSLRIGKVRTGRLTGLGKPPRLQGAASENRLREDRSALRIVLRGGEADRRPRDVRPDSRRLLQREPGRFDVRV